jgi:hypothetical protein
MNKYLIVGFIGKAKNLNPENYIISGKVTNEEVIKNDK